jgi:hypothetical protein
MKTITIFLAGLIISLAFQLSAQETKATTKDPDTSTVILIDKYILEGNLAFVDNDYKEAIGKYILADVSIQFLEDKEKGNSYKDKVVHLVQISCLLYADTMINMGLKAERKSNLEEAKIYLTKMMSYNNRFKVTKDLLMKRLEQGVVRIQDRRNNKLVKNDFNSSKAKGLGNEVGAFDPESFKPKVKVKNGSRSIDVLMKELKKEFNEAEFHYGKKEYLIARNNYAESKSLCEQIQTLYIDIEKKDINHLISKNMLMKSKSRIVEIDKMTDLSEIIKDPKKDQ